MYLLNPMLDLIPVYLFHFPGIVRIGMSWGDKWIRIPTIPPEMRFPLNHEVLISEPYQSTQYHCELIF